MTSAEAGQLLHRFASEHRRRLGLAVQSRERLHASLARGEPPRGPRVDAVLECTQWVLRLLAAFKERYDFLHEDLWGDADDLDVLATLAAKLRGED